MRMKYTSNTKYVIWKFRSEYEYNKAENNESLHEEGNFIL